MPSERTRTELENTRRVLQQLERRAADEDKALATSDAQQRGLAVQLHDRFCQLGGRCAWRRAPEPDSVDGPAWGEAEHQTYLLHAGQLPDVLRVAGYGVTAPRPATPGPQAAQAATPATPASPAPVATAAAPAPAPSAPAAGTAPATIAAPAPTSAATGAPAAPAPAAAGPGGQGGGQAGT
jgi:hypothetical protein